jgi:hypothetical protein
MARLYANENFPLPTVEKLREFGHDLLTTLEAGKAGQRIPDEVVLAFAIAQQRAVLTFNRKHFIRLHRLVKSHHGIVICTADANFERLAHGIHAAILPYEALDNELIRVYRPNLG